jgi:hypothetical protein
MLAAEEGIYELQRPLQECEISLSKPHGENFTMASATQKKNTISLTKWICITIDQSFLTYKNSTPSSLVKKVVVPDKV